MASSSASAAGAAARVGVLLVNLGTPDAPSAPAVRRFLGEFLADPRVVEVPRLIWWPILHGIVLRTRPTRVARKYASVWMSEGSPLLVWSRRQTEGLRALLAASGHDVELELAMRYGTPALDQGLAALRERGCQRILVLPLYPQYSASTNATVFDAVATRARRFRDKPEFRFVQRFYDDPGYIAALAHRVRTAWREHGRGQKLIMSFHGVPQRAIDLGDPYYHECQRTGQLLAAALGLAKEDYVVTYQSRFGAAEWVQPYTEPTLEQFARDGVREVDVFCPGFVSDCLETLEEIAQECAAAFVAAGGTRLRYIPALNDTAPWLQALADIVERNLLGWTRQFTVSEESMTESPKPSPTDTHRETLIDDAVEATFPASDAVSPDLGKRDTPPVQQDEGEAELDEALAETFPASDPISPDAGKKVPSHPPEDKREDLLDEALDDTFPASDPVSLTTPHRKGKR